MTVQALIQTSQGRVIQGLSHRMIAPARPSVPASPYPFNEGTYHILTARGWLDLPASQVSSIAISSTAST